LKTALGEMASMMTTGQRAVPAVAEGHGYQFRFREAQGALRAIFSSLR
jgi:NAD dependent epimerase/dehydratase family enzyme